jgi:hypothetical protein
VRGLQTRDAFPGRSLQAISLARVEILGLDWDDKIEIVTAYMAQKGVTWTQARKDSIRELTEVRYRIYEYPSTLLLGPDGKVIVIEQEKLQGEELQRR